MSQQSNDDLLEAFTCPITHEIMTDPVSASDGHSYERAAIETWLLREHSSPFTKEPISQQELRPNWTLRKAIDEWQTRKFNSCQRSSAKEQQEGQQAEQATATGLIRLAPEKFEAFKRDIIDSLPLSQKDIFTFAINWDSFTNSACASRIQKYISTKVAELLGEEEQTLVAFIMQKLQEHAQASQMLQELVEVLDEDAQEFVLKLYRAVIYETQKCAILGV